MRISLRAISSSLCSVARDTTTPPTVTGSSTATGVSAPVRPTWMVMSRQPGLGLFGGEFMGQRPARCAADHAQALLPVAAVHLVDDAVDVIGQIGALGADLGMKGEGLLDVAAELGQRIDWESRAP